MRPRWLYSGSSGCGAYSGHHHPCAVVSSCSSASAVKCAIRHRLVNASILSSRQDLISGEETDYTCKKTYARKRQQDAINFAVKEKEYLAEKSVRQLKEQQESEAHAARMEEFISEAYSIAGDAGAEKMRQCIAQQKRGRYVRSVDAFSDKSVRLQHTFAGLADNRIIQWWEYLYWNYVRFFFTHEVLIGKDRFGNKFTVTWQFVKSREEQRRMYRREKNQKHQPYGSLATDDRLWERWVRSHRGDPPSIAEEEHNRSYKREFFGAMVLEDEEVEDAMMRMIAHLKRSQSTFQELDDDQVYGDAVRDAKPMRERENKPGEELRTKAQKGATWTLGFYRNDLFYNEEETQVMRSELNHIFLNKQWQSLEYKRQVRMNQRQNPIGKPGENGEAAEPMTHYWARPDLGIPYHDAIPDLTTPELERLRIESDQLEDERLALRKELGLTDLGDIREGRDPIDKGPDPFKLPPVSARWKPKCWEEPWGTGAGLY